MAISGIGSSYNQIGAATNYVQEKTTAKDAVVTGLNMDLKV